MCDRWRSGRRGVARGRHDTCRGGAGRIPAIHLDGRWRGQPLLDSASATTVNSRSGDAGQRRDAGLAGGCRDAGRPSPGAPAVQLPQRAVPAVMGHRGLTANLRCGRRSRTVPAVLSIPCMRLRFRPARRSNHRFTNPSYLGPFRNSSDSPCGITVHQRATARRPARHH